MCDTTVAISVSIPPVPIRGNLRVRGRRSSAGKVVKIIHPPHCLSMFLNTIHQFDFVLLQL